MSTHHSMTASPLRRPSPQSCRVRSADAGCRWTRFVENRLPTQRRARLTAQCLERRAHRLRIEAVLRKHVVLRTDVRGEDRRKTEASEGHPDIRSLRQDLCHGAAESADDAVLLE